MKIFYGFILCFFGLAAALPAQPAGAGQKTVNVVPSPQYEAGWLHRVFFGAHWRDLWTTPLDVPVLDLKTYAGGLTPLRRGGGLQTKSLRLAGADGKQYKFRSLDKDPSKVLPPELQETVVSGVIQDQISTSNPIAAIIVAPIVKGLGILQAEPVLVVLPDDPALGEFREEFGGLIGTLEEHPDEGPDGEPGFAGSEKVISTFSLFERLDEDNSERIDNREFLKARLTDVFLGDWDRHTDQWRWALLEEEGQKRWHPIPRDRDQAFSRYDGLFPWIAARAVRQLEGFGPAYPDMEYLTWAGRFLDRRFLTSLDKPTWDSIAADVHQRLSDDLIEDAVRRMPDEWYAMEGAQLTEDLKQRRDAFPEAAEEYFYYIKEVLDIWLSDRPEYAEIVRLDDRRVSVTVYNRDRETGGKTGPPVYSNVADCEVTTEIRIHLLGGDDYAELSGDVNSSIRVRVIGGKGDDELVDNSIVNGYFLSVVPFVPDAEVKTYFYDSGKETVFRPGPGTAIDTDKLPVPKDWSAKYEPQERDRSHDWRFGPVMGFTTDDGLLFGGGPILYEYGFRNAPWVYRMDLLLGLAPMVGKFRADYTSDIYHLFRGTRWFFHTGISQLERLNFFGMGNATVRDEDLEADDFYKVEQTQIYVNTLLEFPVNKNFAFAITAGVKNVEHDQPEDVDSTLALDSLRPLGIDDLALLSVGAEFSFDTRDFEKAASKGVLLHLSGSHTPEVFNNRESFTRFKGEARAYWTLGSLPSATLALRTGYEKLWGTFPYFEGAFLGGAGSLRGFARERFLGDEAYYFGGDLRISLFRTRILVPGRFGLVGSFDAGRVFVEDLEEDDTLHTNVGGGLWLEFFSPEMTLSATVHNSDEVLTVFIGGGFLF